MITIGTGMKVPVTVSYRFMKSNCVSILMIGVLSGLGLGLVLDGKLYQGSRGLIEGGHTIVNNKNHGRKCSCGQVGCVEAYSSAKNTSIRMFEMDVAEERERAKKRASFSVYPDKVLGERAKVIFMQQKTLIFIHFSCNEIVVPVKNL